MQAIAITPGTSRLANAASPPAPPTPCPIFGKTYVNTKTNNSGCMMVRSANWMNVFRSTATSRRSMFVNAIMGVLRWGPTSGSAIGGPVSSTLIPSGPSR